MSLSIEVKSPDHDGDSWSLASASGWRLVRQWADSLPQAFDAVRGFANDGHADNTARLCQQFARALKAQRPTNGAVADTIRKLLVAMDGGSPVESATVVLHPSDDDDDEHDFADTALHGHDGAKADQLLRSAQERGSSVLGLIARKAVADFLAGGGTGSRLFSDAQRQRLAAALTDTMATAELLGRSRIRLRAEQAEANAGKQSFSDQPTDLHRFDERGVLAPMTPAKAVEYFRSLVPAIGVKDARAWAQSLGRKAFTLAVDADGVLLGKIKDAIRSRLETGEGIRSAPKEIEAYLDAAGVAPANPSYPTMVFRTNMMDAYNTGAENELAEVKDTFPVWRYANPSDSRSRPEHAKKNGRYYSSARRFSDVRGTDAGDVCNCRCTPIPIDKWEWSELQAAGASAEE